MSYIDISYDKNKLSINLLDLSGNLESRRDPKVNVY